ncbi:MULTISPECIES: LysR family transcriptional regulator [unclassified Enterococcus]|uniref:LysR family transcriptional regulator n=1 Tax=unclassified Enterococcus TaxID=2608891 RepID=UPI001553E55C|nr:MULTISPECIES: LysR family transcriptional regulator [unclassified Enterococcus]MBS7576304.1 LysR family transcriptional regulator [Enterococcus sp. MMGLQ5-2]MBS7583537.1 LysR family transcriptional regulator [Enterococcus sp. MMGLQ5-1]NPD11399.1 LysR family transcriptional regulator [Enterococcus sp. MMGLQ5-1]NPD36142.1 LysR family transcriptional regulator [Enterococcus sp. MMGLQ5-2]
MNFQQFKYIDAIEKTGSINAAAQSLFVTASTISSALKGLEAELGLQIFTRSKKGMVATHLGADFIRSIRGVLSQMTEIEAAYLNHSSHKKVLSITSQHYDFASVAFANLIQTIDTESYTFRFLETDTKQVISDVKHNISQIGLIYLSAFNSKILNRVLEQEGLSFHPLFSFQPHVFLGKTHPLAQQDEISYDQLDKYPAITFEQAEDSPIYFSEEPQMSQNSAKKIIVGDRASAINILIHSESYLIGSGIMSSNITKNELIVIPIATPFQDTIGWLQNKDSQLLPEIATFLQFLRAEITDRLI